MLFFERMLGEQGGALKRNGIQAEVIKRMSFWTGCELHCGAVECRYIFSEVSSSNIKLSGDEKSGWEEHTRLCGLASLFLLCLIYPSSFSLVLDRLCSHAGQYVYYFRRQEEKTYPAREMDLQLDDHYDNED